MLTGGAFDLFWKAEWVSYPFYLSTQESPPAWTQEAYRPPRSKCSLWRGGYPNPGGYPIPGLGGTPCQVWEGYPMRGLGGTLCQVWGGVPHPSSGGVPCPMLGGTPSQVQVWGVPHPDLVVGGTPSWPGGGYPRYPPPPARPGMGYPPGQTWYGVPPGQTWDGVPPPGQTWDGVPPPARPGMGYPPPSQTWDGVSPPPPRCELTNKLKTVPSLIFRMRAVITFVTVTELVDVDGP